MRRTPASRLPLWVRHACRPAVVATVFGGLFGAALLRMQPAEFAPENLYSEPATRAATYEPSPSAAAFFALPEEPLPSFTDRIVVEETTHPLADESENLVPVVLSQ